MFNTNIVDATFVVFDVETTGFKAISEQMIEIGAVKINYKGEVLDTFSKFIKLYRHNTIPAKIVELTHITDNMLIHEGEDVHEVMDEFCHFIGDSFLVAQNAKFDMSFLAAYFIQNHHLTYSRVCFDTIGLAKKIYPNQATYKLSALAPMFEVEYDPNAHHRADYDAKITADIFAKQLSLLPIKSDTPIRKLIAYEDAQRMTQRQESYLNSLINQHGIKTNQLEYFTKTSTSCHIDIIKNLGLYD